MAEFYRLNAIVPMVDAKHAPQHLDDGHEAQEQVAFADVLVLNKTDLVDEQQLQQPEQRLRSMNPFAKLYRSQRSKIELDNILGIHAFDLEKKLEAFLNEWLRDHGTDTFRYKSILNMKGVKQRIVFQGIHMLFESTPDREWRPDETRKKRDRHHRTQPGSRLVSTALRRLHRGQRPVKTQ